MRASAEVCLVVATLFASGCGNASDDLDVHTERDGDGTGGASGSGSGGTSGAGGGTSATGGAMSGSGGASDDPNVLCDGSSEIRFGITINGEQLEPTDGFTSPYGVKFLFVDGQCRYWTSNWWMRGAFEGVLDDAAASDLADRVGWGRISTWSSHVDEGCPDSGQTTLRGPDSAASCACGCDADAPPGMDEAFSVTTEVVTDLGEAGAPLSAVRVLVVDVGDAPTGSPSPWPFIWDPADVAVTLDGATDLTEASVLVDDPVEAAELQELRRFTFEDTFNSRVTVEGPNGARYELYIRDEPPSDVAAAITAFIR